ncbi:MAG TPA: hypothetical protein VJ672_07220 [Gemmatimonadaceae bacterium]|nr:hypothetical protein [Gemmatimonadaceae bacterium]
MRTTFTSLVVAAVWASTAAAQQPDSAKADSAARADSLKADSIRIVRELEGAAPGAPQPMTPQHTMTPPPNARLIPDISAIGDFLFDFSPDESTLEGGERAQIREVEVGLQAAVDPYFRADMFLAVHDEAIHVEEAYLTAMALPWGLQARIGRFHMPIGKQNTTHRPELHTIEYPYIIQRFLGPDGSAGNGLWVSKIFSPLGFYQELQLTAVDNFTAGEEHGGAHAHDEEGEEEVAASDAANNRLSGIGYTARFRNYWDLNESTNLEISASAATQRLAMPIVCLPDTDVHVASCADFGGPTGVNARQSVLGADVTFRWRPLQQGLYKSLIVQGEVMRVLNDDNPALPDLPGATVFYEGPTRDVTGAYAFARYQLTRRTYIGARYDWLQDPVFDDDDFNAVSGYLTFFPSEFSKIVLGYERLMPAGNDEKINRFVLQTTFSIGPHRPHPF